MASKYFVWLESPGIFRWFNGKINRKSWYDHGMIMVCSCFTMVWCVFMCLYVFNYFESFMIHLNKFQMHDSSFHPWRLGTLECRRCPPPGGCGGCHQKSRFWPFKKPPFAWQNSRSLERFLQSAIVDHGYFFCRVCQYCNLVGKPWFWLSIWRHLSERHVDGMVDTQQKAMGPESHRGPLNIQRGWSTANSHGSFTHRGFTIPYVGSLWLSQDIKPHKGLGFQKWFKIPTEKWTKTSSPQLTWPYFARNCFQILRSEAQIPTHTADSEIWTLWRLHPMGRAWWVADLTDFFWFSYWDLDDLARKTLDNLLEIEESSHFLGKQTCRTCFFGARIAPQ